MSLRFPAREWEVGAGPVCDDDLHPWGRDPGDMPPGWFPDDDEELDPTEGHAEEFIHYLGQLYCRSKISAGDFSILCYHARMAGMKHIDRYGMPPGRHTGHYSRHVKSLFKYSENAEAMYNVVVPGLARHELSRSQLDLVVAPPHELVEEKVQGEPGILARLDTAASGRRLPPVYYTNPVVKNSEQWPIALGLYLDGVPYSHTDSVCGLWVLNIVEGSRVLIATIRKRICCRCGCKGWDTFPLFVWPRHCFQYMAAGCYPAARHDGEPWTKRDRRRQALAGTPFSRRSVLIQLRGDWAEICERIGMPNWGSHTRPCPACAVPPDQMYNLAGASVARLPFHVNTHADWERACSNCEMKVLITHENVKLMVSLLRFDKRKTGALGRSLIVE